MSTGWPKYVERLTNSSEHIVACCIGHLSSGYPLAQTSPPAPQFRKERLSRVGSALPSSSPGRYLEDGKYFWCAGEKYEVRRRRGQVRRVTGEIYGKVVIGTGAFFALAASHAFACASWTSDEEVIEEEIVEAIRSVVRELQGDEY